MLIVVIISAPICVSWQSQYASAEGYDLFTVLVGIFINFSSLFACALLGPNRKRGLIASVFIFFIIYSATEMFVIFLIASFTYPLLNSDNTMHLTFGMPQFHYAAIFLSNLIVMCHCFIAAHWIRKIPENTPIKFCVLFCLFLLFYSVTTVFWSVMSVARMPPVFFSPSVLLGALLMSIPILSLYFFTRLVSRSKSIPANEKESENTAHPEGNLGLWPRRQVPANTEYAQFIGQLSKREMEVISAVLAGSLRYKTLASSLNISVNTVKTHLQHIYQITGVNNIETLSALFSGYSTTRSEIISKSP
jgi:DNA-binding CsgD family transcriptional regulator